MNWPTGKDAVLDHRTVNKKLVGAKRGWQSLALFMLPLTAVWAVGQGRLEQTFDTIRNPRISVINLKGEVIVRGWNKAQVHATYAVASPRVEVDTEVLPRTGPADKIHFATHVLDPLATENDQMADYTLDVPVGASVEIRNRQGSVRIEKLQADAAVDSVDGDIVVTDFSGHLAVKSVGGNLEIVRPTGTVDASSITGNLHFVSPATTKLRGSTTSGRILYEGDFMGDGDYMLSTYSGDMDVLCPPSASYELSAKTWRGKLVNTLPITPRRHSPSPLSSGNSLLGTHNTGKATVELRSFSGTIHIHPQ